MFDPAPACAQEALRPRSPSRFFFGFDSSDVAATTAPFSDQDLMGPVLLGLQRSRGQDGPVESVEAASIP